jgi:hypothetical protein
MERSIMKRGCAKHPVHVLDVPYATDEIHDALAYVEFKGDKAQSRLCQLLSVAPLDPPSDKECDEAGLLREIRVNADDIPPVLPVPEDLGYRAGGILEMLAFARRYRDLLTSADILYGFGQGIADPKDPGRILVTVLKVASAGRLALTIESVPPSDGSVISIRRSDKRIWSLVVRRVNVTVGTCAECVPNKK